MTREIPLRDRDGNIVAIAIVDDADHARLTRHRWSLAHSRPRRMDVLPGGRQRNVALGREVMQLGPEDEGVIVRPINGDPLDCRRINLELANKRRAVSLPGRPGPLTVSDRAVNTLCGDSARGFFGVGPARCSGQLVQGEAPMATKRTPASKPETVVSTRPPCLCGCGGFPRGPKSRYVAGHDARHHSALRRAAKAAAETAVPVAPPSPAEKPERPTRRRVPPPTLAGQDGATEAAPEKAVSASPRQQSPTGATTGTGGR